MATDNKVVAAGKAVVKMLVPPDERFWKRYSPHHEAPLSGIASAALHALALGLVLLIAKLVIDKDDNPPVNVDAVRVVIPGGGGSPGGRGGGPGLPNPGDAVERGDPAEDPERKPATSDRLPLTVAQQHKVEQQFDNDPAVKRLIKQSTEASGALFNLDKDVRDQLRKNINPAAGAGKGGTGRDGGRDRGKDRGEGAGTGTGGTLNQREKRVLRWAMTFNTRDGRDYLAQLDGLGAIVAFPFPGGAGNRFDVMRDLKKPAEIKQEDVAAINRIYWVDDKPQSVQSLCRALGRDVPPFFVAFFPLDLERKLLDLELAEMRRKYGSADENRIHETKFDVVAAGGAYDVRVRSVTLKR